MLKYKIIYKNQNIQQLLVQKVFTFFFKCDCDNTAITDVISTVGELLELQTNVSPFKNLS